MTQPSAGQRDQVLASIYQVIDELNLTRPRNVQIEKGPETPLFGVNGRLDSLALVNLIVSLEQRLNDDLDASVTLADEKAMSQRNSPFRTIGTLVDYVMQLIEEANV